MINIEKWNFEIVRNIIDIKNCNKFVPITTWKAKRISIIFYRKIWGGPFITFLTMEILYLFVALEGK